MNIFEYNSDSSVEVEYLDGSPIYTIENFYTNPEKVYENLFEIPLRENFAPLWKINQTPSNNGIHFEDRRVNCFSDEIIDIYFLLNDIIGNYSFVPEINTNIFSLKNDEKSKKFNNYKDNVWWPHTDLGYNGIIYFHDECGTNLYKPISKIQKKFDEIEYTKNEHYKPWRPKCTHHILKTIDAKYNKLVLFDGKKFPHGMNITSDFYSEKNYRGNQVFFFHNEDPFIDVFCL
tara:strand:+ start:1099 stop:1794 length:696 start_codon:yes stop_codon:yes gene_type:complete